MAHNQNVRLVLWESLVSLPSHYYGAFLVTRTAFRTGNATRLGRPRPNDTLAKQDLEWWRTVPDHSNQSINVERIKQQRKLASTKEIQNYCGSSPSKSYLQTQTYSLMLVVAVTSRGSANGGGDEKMF
jgi:hypothetical protein